MDGFIEVIHNCSDEQFVVVTMDDSNKYYMNVLSSLPNVTMKINEPFENMVDIYNSYSYFRLYPVGIEPLNIEPFCRVVAEAVMCGMELNVGDNVGAKTALDSLGLDEFRKQCTEAPQRFWEAVENV